MNNNFNFFYLNDILIYEKSLKITFKIVVKKFP